MTKSSLDVPRDLLQNNSQELTELIHFRLIKPLMKAHTNTDQLNIVVFFFSCVGEIEAFVLLQRSKGEFELSAAFPIQSRIKAISAENYNYTHSEAIHISCDYTESEKLRVLKIWSRSLERMY